MEYEKEFKIKFQAPLTDLDSETQTNGCRANTSDICDDAYFNNICAFINSELYMQKLFLRGKSNIRN